MKRWLVLGVGLLSVGAGTMAGAPAVAQAENDQANEYIVANSILAYDDKCHVLIATEREAVKVTAEDAITMVPGDTLLGVELKTKQAVASAKNAPCSDQSTAQAKASATNTGLVWIARARAVANAGKNASWAYGLTKLDYLQKPLDGLAGVAAKAQPTGAFKRNLQATSEATQALTAVCAKRRPGGKGCPAYTGDAQFAEYAAGWVDRVERFGMVAAGEYQGMVDKAEAAAHPGLTKPVHPTDYYAFSSLGDITFSHACKLGDPVAYLPSAQIPATPKEGMSVKAPIHLFGGKDRLGTITVLWAGVWTIVGVDPAVKDKVGGATKLTQCSYS